MKLIALNLSRSMTEEELAKLFMEFGEVQSCNLVLDKVTNTSKGFGFVEMPNENEANSAITALHGKKIAGGKIRVKNSDKTSEDA